MQGLAPNMQLDEAEFSFNSSGGIDTSGMLTSSKMLVNFLAAKEAPSEYLSAKVHSTTQAFWDFDAQGRTIESANIGRAKFTKEQLEFEAKEKEKDADEQQDNAVVALALMEDIFQPEDYELQDWNINGQDYQVSNAGISATLDRIRDDLDGMADEYNLSDDQKQKLSDLEQEMRGKSPEEQQAILDRYAKNNPEVVDAFMQEGEKQANGLKNELDKKLEQTSEVQQQTQEQVALDTGNMGTSSDALFGNEFGAGLEISSEFNPNAIGNIPAPMEQVASITPKVEVGLG